MVCGVHHFVVKFNISGYFVSETVRLGMNPGLVHDVEVCFTGILLLKGDLYLEKGDCRQRAFFSKQFVDIYLSSCKDLSTKLFKLLDELLSFARSDTTDETE